MGLTLRRTHEVHLLCGSVIPQVDIQDKHGEVGLARVRLLTGPHVGDDQAHTWRGGNRSSILLKMVRAVTDDGFLCEVELALSPKPHMRARTGC